MRLGESLTQALDRRGGRAVLGWLAGWRATRQLHERVRIRWVATGVWVAQYPNVLVPVRAPFGLTSPEEHDATAIDVFLQEHIPGTGEVVVDVGAGVGWELHLLSRLVGPSGHVYAIEAHPETCRWLQRRVDLNDMTNVTVVNVAVGDRHTDVYMSSLDYHEANHVVPTPSGCRVEGITLEALLDRYAIEHVDFLKMNIEGGERAAITTLPAVARRVTNVCIGCHDFLADRGGSDSTRTKAAVRQTLSICGYQVVERRADESRDWARDYLYGRLHSHTRAPAPR